MQKCSVDFILDLKLWCWQKDVFMKIDIDNLLIGQVELLRIRLKFGRFIDVVDLCSKHKLQLIDNYSNEHRYKCVYPFSTHKQLVKASLHEVTLPKLYRKFSIYNPLPGQRVCMNFFKRAKDNVAACSITIENELAMDEKEEKMKSQLKLHTI